MKICLWLAVLYLSVPAKKHLPNELEECLWLLLPAAAPLSALAKLLTHIGPAYWRALWRANAYA